MSKVLNDIKHAKSLIEDEKLRRNIHERYSPCYLFTTENIKGYVNEFDFTDSSVLTITGSGDQALNVIKNKAKYVMCFDINEISNYCLHLKVAAVKALNNFEFFNFYLNYEKYFNNKYFERIKNYLTEDNFIFWNTIFNEYNPKDIKKLFMEDWSTKEHLKRIDNYVDLIDFYKLKKHIYDCEIKTITTNIKQLIENLSKDIKFDYILLSNISTYIKFIFAEEDCVKSFIHLVKLLSNYLNENGKILYAYEYCFHEQNSVFAEFNTQKLLIPTPNSFDLNNTLKDAVFYFTKSLNKNSINW